MINKKAIELSLNFLVILIISIIVFGFGVRFLFNLFSSAMDVIKLTEDEIDRQLGDLVCQGNERICIGFDRKTISKGRSDILGIKIINILDSQNFDVVVSQSDPIGYKNDKTPISKSRIQLNPTIRSKYILKNEEDKLGFQIIVPSNAISGTYIFEVQIKDSGGNLYGSNIKFYVDIP